MGEKLLTAVNDNPVSLKSELVDRSLNNEVLIYDLQSDKAFCLNEMSALIWHLCDGHHSISKISEQLSQKLNKNVTEDLVCLGLEELKRVNLLQNADHIETKFAGLSR